MAKKAGKVVPINEARAQWAEEALAKFVEVSGGSLAPDDVRRVVGDLITDLGHYCTSRGLPFFDILEKAAADYRGEVATEGNVGLEML